MKRRLAAASPGVRWSCQSAKRADADAGEGDHLAPGQIAAARPLRPRRRMRQHGATSTAPKTLWKLSGL